MKHQAWITAMAWALLFSSATSARASVLLTSVDFSSMGGSGPCIIAPVEFFLGIDGPPPFYCKVIGRGLAAWNDGESGSYEITPSNEPLWNEFSASLTNGLDDQLLLLTEIRSSEGAGGCGGLESWFFPTGHDLAGNQLDFVRLDVSNVHIWTIDPAVQWQGWTADVTYEFWGTPLPEPATTLPILLAALLWRRGRQRRSL
jgi:hypothetical protein